MGLNLATRIEKLEEAAGINEPCGLCADRETAWRKFRQYLVDRGVTVPEPKRCDIVTIHCLWCGADHPTDCTGVSQEERDALKRINLSHIAYSREERLPSEEILSLIEWLTERQESHGRALYGDLYDEALRHCGRANWKTRHETWKRANYPHLYKAEQDERREKLTEKVENWMHRHVSEPDTVEEGSLVRKGLVEEQPVEHTIEESPPGPLTNAEERALLRARRLQGV